VEKKPDFYWQSHANDALLRSAVRSRVDRNECEDCLFKRDIERLQCFLRGSGWFGSRTLEIRSVVPVLSVTSKTVVASSQSIQHCIGRADFGIESPALSAGGRSVSPNDRSTA
jgi:hypothetical protein